mmetsp:Transcript_27341/g.63750  ORF Transcript_27341/g.63750 Transcript_27341/m.63750 type:complete len:476 (-) Transcript_27341:7-1434(-)
MPPKIFKGQVFALSGRLSQPQKEYEELIKKNGGEVAPSLTTAVTILVSTADDVKACSQKVATANGRGVPIVQEGFVGACIAAKKILPMSHFEIKGAGKKRKAKAKAGAAASSAGGAKAPEADATEEPAPKRAKKAESVITTSDSAPVIVKSGLADKAAVVKEEVKKGFIQASLCWDVELVLNDPATGKDRYYNMQLLSGTVDDTAGMFWTVQHYGRTGLDGRVHVDGPHMAIDTAKMAFRKKYRSKTGNVWGQLGGTFVEHPGKYKLLAKAEEVAAKADAGAERSEAASKVGKWQYYLHNALDGKEIGWHDYAEEAGANMEKFWKVCETNEGLAVRFVQTKYYKYEVNFTEMIQTNIKTGTRRVIRRVAEGERASDDPPEKVPDPVPPKKVPDEEEEDEDDDEADEDGAEYEDEEEEEEDCDDEAEVKEAKGRTAAAAEEGSTDASAAKTKDGADEADTVAAADTMADTLPFGPR